MILAIDPGACGGLAWLDNATAQCIPMPAAEGDLMEAIRAATRLRDHRENGVAYLEQLVKHMGLGIPASTMAVYASNWGFIKGALQAFKWRIILVRPQEWQKGLALGITGRQRADIHGMTTVQAKVEKKRVASLNAQLKRDWKAKLAGEAARRFPECKVTLKTADALLILDWAKMQE